MASGVDDPDAAAPRPVGFSEFSHSIFELLEDAIPNLWNCGEAPRIDRDRSARWDR
jgi:hypothetical protein